MATEISTIGEFGLIKRLTQNIELKNPETKYGVGDDCAVLKYGEDKDILVTTDLLMEGRCAFRPDLSAHEALRL